MLLANSHISLLTADFPLCRTVTLPTVVSPQDAEAIVILEMLEYAPFGIIEKEFCDI